MGSRHLPNVLTPFPVRIATMVLLDPGALVPINILLARLQVVLGSSLHLALPPVPHLLIPFGLVRRRIIVLPGSLHLASRGQALGAMVIPKARIHGLLLTQKPVPMVAFVLGTQTARLSLPLSYFIA